MNSLWLFVNLLVMTKFVACRDFYLGMFRRNDFLVAQDIIYKAPSPFGYTTASYGRLFKCPITYFRVVDRLGMGRGPFTTIVRGGLKKKFITIRIKSSYRLPVSVNIYVGCENKQPSTFRTTLRTTTITPKTDASSDSVANTTDSITTISNGDGGGGKDRPDKEPTDPDKKGDETISDPTNPDEKADEKKSEPTDPDKKSNDTESEPANTDKPADEADAENKPEE